MNEIISTGTILDNLLPDSGYKVGNIYQLFGPSKSGKTIVALEALKNFSLKNKSCVYVDTQSGLTDYYTRNIPNIDFIYINRNINDDLPETIINLLGEDSIEVIILDSIVIFEDSSLCSDFLRRISLMCARLKKTLIFTNEVRRSVFKKTKFPYTPKYGICTYKYSYESIYLKNEGKFNLTSEYGFQIGFNLVNKNVSGSQRFYTEKGFK